MIGQNGTEILPMTTKINLKTITDLVSWFIATIFLTITSYLPRKLRNILGVFIGNLLYHILSRKRCVANQNLKIAFPNFQDNERKKLLHRSFISLGHGLVELGIIWRRKTTKTLSMFTDISGTKEVEEAYKLGYGVILFTAHLGSWESAILYISNRWPIKVLYKQTKNHHINNLMIRGRANSGATLINKNSGVKQLVSALHCGEMVGILPDQNVARHEGVFSNFFNRPACTTTLIGRLSNKMNSPVFGVFCYRLPKSEGLKLTFIRVDINLGQTPQEQVDIINKTIEQAILYAPEQYWWVHKRYKELSPGLSNPYSDCKHDA